MHIYRLPSGRYLNLDRIVDVRRPRAADGGGVRVVMAAPQREDVGAHDLATSYYDVDLVGDDAEALLARLEALASIETGYLEGMYRGGPDR